MLAQQREEGENLMVREAFKRHEKGTEQLRDMTESEGDEKTS